jgi:uncharacterized membrane protein (Fun14 family)
MSTTETINAETTSFWDSLPIFEVSSGFFIGMAVGYFFKKSFKIVLLLFGLIMVAVFFLEAKDIVHVNTDALLSVTDKLVIAIKNVAGFLKERLAFLQISGGVGAVAGFVVGLKMG